MENLALKSASETFVMIGGTTRAGTTSLHKYLSDHADICASSQKETRYFLDDDYPSPYPVTYRYGRHSLDKYYEYFDHRDSKVFLEATPDYLYSAQTPKKVKESLDNVKWIFILRDPIERLISWYHFGRRFGRLDSDISLEGFIEMQLNGTALQDAQIFRTLEQGKYSIYLRSYYELFGKENILLLPFGALEKNPVRFMQRVCEFIGISASCYTNYAFSALNSSVALKHVGSLEKIYSMVFVNLYLRVYNKPSIRKWLHIIRTKLVEPIYLTINIAKNNETKISAMLEDRLEEYYSGELQRLEGLSGDKFSWG